MASSARCFRRSVCLLICLLFHVLIQLLHFCFGVGAVAEFAAEILMFRIKGQFRTAVRAFVLYGIHVVLLFAVYPRLLPQLVQKLPVFSVPQLHFQEPAGAGFLLPQLVQKLLLLTVPQEQVQPFAAAAAGAACC